MLDGQRVLGFDLETTGFDPRSDRIVQYAFVGSDFDGLHVGLQSVVDPGVRIPPEATSVHGISDADVSGKGGFSDHLGVFSDLIGGSVIVGHNVLAFDWRFVEMEYARVGREVPEPLGILDTLVLSRRVGLPRPHKLGSLCERFGIALERAHTADADAGAALLLLWKIMQGLAKKSDRSLEGLLNLMGNRA